MTKHITGDKSEQVDETMLEQKPWENIEQDTNFSDEIKIFDQKTFENKNPANPAFIQKIWNNLKTAPNWIRHQIDVELSYGQQFILLPLVLAFGIAFWLTREREIVYAAAIIPIIGLLFIYRILGEKRRFTQYLCKLTLVFFVGLLVSNFQNTRMNTIVLDSQVTTHITGLVQSREKDHRGHWRYVISPLKTEKPKLRRPPEKVKILARSRHEALKVGDVIKGRARLSPPSGPAYPGGYDFAYYGYYKGVGANGFFMGKPKVGPPAEFANKLSLYARYIEPVREIIAARILTILSGDTGAVAVALVIAKRRSIEPKTANALRATGLAHILAISGLHMALVAGTMFAGLRYLLALNPALIQAYSIKKYAAIAALFVATFYLTISGAAVSTQRAWIMLAIMLFAVVLGRTALTLRNVAIAAIIVLLITPSAILSPGFQMSFVATASLIGVYSIFEHKKKHAQLQKTGLGAGIKTVFGFFAAMALTSLIAGTSTALIAAMHFHLVPVYGAVTNIAAMPIVTLVVMPALLISIILMPYGLEYVPIKIAGYGIDLIIEIAKFFQQMGAMINVGKPNTTILVLLILALGILVLARSKLRFFSIFFVLCALAFSQFSPTPHRPSIIIAENGRLVAVATDNGYSTNSFRKSNFIIKQWKNAYPVSSWESAKRQKAPKIPKKGYIDKNDYQKIEEIFETIKVNKIGFKCISRIACIGKGNTGKTIVVLKDLRFLRPACRLGDIVVTSKNIRVKTRSKLKECTNHPFLFDGKRFRQTGSVEIYLDENKKITLKYAQDKNLRAWNKHRQFDWKTGLFTK